VEGLLETEDAQAPAIDAPSKQGAHLCANCFEYTLDSAMTPGLYCRAMVEV